MFGLLGLLPTYGENVLSTAPLEIYLLGIMVTCSILILPSVCVLKNKTWCGSKYDSPKK